VGQAEVVLRKGTWRIRSASRSARMRACACKRSSRNAGFGAQTDHANFYVIWKSEQQRSTAVDLWTRSPASSNRPFCFDYGCSQLVQEREKENGRRILCRVGSTMCETDVRLRKREAGSCLKGVGGARWSAVRNRVRGRVATPFERMACKVKSRRSWLKQQACSAGRLMAGR
jgi:hypothetical protein